MTINKQPIKKAATKTAAAKKATGSSAKKTAPAIIATKSGDERIMVPLRLLTPSKFLDPGLAGKAAHIVP